MRGRTVVGVGCWRQLALAEGREVADNVHFQVAVSLGRLNNGIV